MSVKDFNEEKMWRVIEKIWEGLSKMKFCWTEEGARVLRDKLLCAYFNPKPAFLIDDLLLILIDCNVLGLKVTQDLYFLNY